MGHSCGVTGMTRLAVLLLAMLVALAMLMACGSDRADERVIRIGVAVSETGRFEEEGEHTRRGYLLWEAWVNEEYGGIKVGAERYRAQLIIYDDKSDPDTTAELVERLIDEDKVDFMLGPYSSTLTQPAIEVAEERGVIMVEGTGASETLFQQSYRNLFAVLTPAGDYSESALKALADLGARSVVIASANERFPASLVEGARRWAQEYGLEVLGDAGRYLRGTTDVRDLLQEFKALNPDVVLGGTYYEDAVLFVRTAKELDFNPRAMVLTVGPNNPGFVDNLGEDANYVMSPTQWESSMTYEGDYFGSASDYAERYETEWGSAPAYQAASATAAALALHLAIESAGSLDTDAVRTALHDMDVDTFYGRINFDETGKNVAKPMGTIQIQDGHARLVAPADVSVAALIYPAPSWQDR